MYGRGVTITETEKGLYHFQFYHRLDLERVTEGGPWSFDNHLLVLGRVQIGTRLFNVSLFHVAFSLQIHNLLLGFMTSSVGTHLGNYIGTFMEYDKSNNMNLWRKYIRLRVSLDVRVPLKKSWKVVSSDFARVKTIDSGKEETVGDLWIEPDGLIISLLRIPVRNQG